MEYYIIEASVDNKKWKHMARFNKGQRSRYDDKPFNAELAVEEVRGFKKSRGGDFPFVRLIISLEEADIRYEAPQSTFCPHCHKRRRMKGDGTIEKLCEC